MEKQLLDRRTPPKAAEMEKILFPEAHIKRLDNGISVYMVPFGNEEVVELRCIFPAGRSFEQLPGQSSFTGKMIQEGTASYTGLEFARKLDQFGAFVHVESGYESTTVSLTSLTKHLHATLDLYRELIMVPAFPEKELHKLVERTIQHLDVEEQKTAYIARKEFNRLLFGQAHPYGRGSERSDIEALTLAHLVDFHQRNMNLVNATFIAVGRFDTDKLLAQLNNRFGSLKDTDLALKIDPETSSAKNLFHPPATGMHYFEKEDSMQATVRVGHRSFARSHPDYYRMQVVNTMLGGYFGSRLMKNIREDKGFTYGIGAAWLGLKYSGTFLIQTDVGNEYVRPTLDEIDHELRRLIVRGCSGEELRLVKNYMLGRSTSSRETPAQIANLMKNMLVNGMPFSTLDDKFDIIQSVTTEDVKALATQYYRPDNMLKVVCGKMEPA